jgi:hypothetical protein
VIKHFCDCCAVEITRTNSEPLVYNAPSKANANVTLGVSVNSATVNNTPSTDVCKYCLLDALKSLDDRAPGAPYGSPPQS